MPEGLAAELLARLEQEVETDDFIGRGGDFLAEASRIKAHSLLHGEFHVPPDPFRGPDADSGADPDLYYTMFWRMFDRTPTAMIQGFAIPLRRILARKLFKSCGDGVIIHHNVLFSLGRNISLGDGVLVNRNSMLDDRGPIEVGAYTMLAAGITIETHTHPFEVFDRPIAYAGRGFAPVTIGANSVIGYNTVVMAGSSIGYRCIVGANSVVTGDVPDYTIVGGVPAKPIKMLEPAGEDELRDLIEGGEWKDPQLPD